VIARGTPQKAISAGVLLRYCATIDTDVTAVTAVTDVTEDPRFSRNFLGHVFLDSYKAITTIVSNE
jgi:hypothetical protein